MLRSQITPPRQCADKQRIIYIDALRGFTMLLVIYSHVFAYLSSITSDINTILLTFRMPLFFFISGFFMYNIDYNISLLKRRTTNRIIKQLFPTIIFFSLYVCISGKSFANGIASPFKAGYWFTFVSIEIFLIIAPILCLMSLKQFSKQKQFIIFCTIFIASYFIKSILASLDKMHPLITYLDIDLIFTYIPYVILGCILKMSWPEHREKILRGIYCCIAIILFSFGVMYDLPFKDLIMGICGIYLMLYIFYSIPSSTYSTKIGKFMIFIGKSTLEIYLLHYFVFGLINRIPHLPNMISRVLHNTNSYWEIPIVLTISIGISILCMTIVRLMKVTKIYPVLFPDVKPRKEISNLPIND